MGFSISKNSGATTYTITHFSSIAIDGINLAESIGDIMDDDEAAPIVKAMGPKSKVVIDWTIIPEASSVVSGSGGTVTEVPEQVNYLMDTLRSQGEDQITDNYILTITYSGGTTFQRTGSLAKILCTIAASNPLVFNGHIEFEVGTVL